MFFTLLKDFLSLQLIIYQSIRSLFRLFNECAADIDTLVAEHLQRELDSPIFGFAQTSVSQLSDELSLRTDSWFHYEVESAIRQLLGNALRTESRYLISHSLLVGRKEKTLALIIESHTTQLHVLAAIILLELIATIVFLVVPFSIIFLHV